MPPHSQDILAYFARHGTTTLNATGCFRGPLNPSLDAAGHKDAHQLKYYFEPIDLSYCFASSKLRTMQTAKRIVEPHFGLEVTPHDGLWALDVGELGGKPRNAENIEIVKHHIENPDEPFPGGESLNGFRERIRPLVIEGIDLAIASPSPVLFVVHSSVIHEVGNIINGDHQSVLVIPGGVSAIYLDPATRQLKAEAIFKADVTRKRERAELTT